MELQYRLEFEGTVARIIGVIKGAVLFAFGAVVAFSAYYLADELQLWQMVVVGLIAAVCVLLGLYTAIAAVTKDDYEATIGTAGS